MAQNSAIEWTETTWNPLTGCTKISPGCKHCYAERLAVRLQAMGNPRYRHAFDVTLHPDQIELPLRWRRPRRIFVNSMSDLYHEAVPDEYIQRVFDVMVRAEQHVFQVLTKRSERLPEIARRLPWPPNVWQGVSVENADYVARIADLRQVPAAVRFLSVEPLLGAIPKLPLDGIHWVICGGESGQHLAALVAPLLIHDLPVTVWWPGEPHFESRSARELLPMADRVIVDGSGWSGDGVDGLGAMCSLVAGGSVRGSGPSEKRAGCGRAGVAAS